MGTVAILGVASFVGLLATLCSVAAAVAVHRRKHRARRDDTLRAGQDADQDPQAAARRGGGLTAWMRTGGM